MSAFPASMTGQTDEPGEAPGGTTPGWSPLQHWAWLLPMSVVELEGVGPRRAATLGEFGVQTVGQLLLRLPRKYIDRSRVLPIREAPLGEEVTVVVSVLDSAQPSGGRRRGARTRAPMRVRLGDSSGELDCVWFHGGYQSLNHGDTIAVSGKIERYGSRLQIVHPEIELISEGDGQDRQGAGTIHTGAIVPVYGSGEDLKSAGLTSRRWRSLVRAALDRFGAEVDDPLPPHVCESLGLPGLYQSLQAVHAPASLDEAELARRRLAFDELLGLQVELARRRQARLSGRGIQHTARSLVEQFVASMPFSLTHAQNRVIEEILDDMGGPSPMRRLLHGEVGSGKTVVALCAALAAVENGCQIALMVPTEVLAEQHFATIQNTASFTEISSVLLLGGQRSGNRREVLAAVQSGNARLIIGTHALFQSDVHFERLGLIIVDEQHRFGVAQRDALGMKGSEADVLVMTATPIPRSLALTMYGDLDVSTLDELPSGRRAVRTVLRGSAQRPQVLEFVAGELEQGRQAYFVYPMIDESENAGPLLTSASAAFEALNAGPLEQFDLRVLHGRMSSAEKSEVMAAFSRGQCQALVCTSVVEVGLDVPGATIMVVENADRFGLAQLHQLRGRVGRGGADVQAYCILIADHGQDEIAAQRLQVLCETSNGFEIAQKDLELRGPGELQGMRQAGMPGFLVAGPADEDLLLAARDQASQMLNGEPVETGGCADE